jgi:hypothetical protein
MLSTVASTSHRTPLRIVQGYLVADAIRAGNESIHKAGAKALLHSRSTYANNAPVGANDTEGAAPMIAVPTDTVMFHGPFRANDLRYAGVEVHATVFPQPEIFGGGEVVEAFIVEGDRRRMFAVTESVQALRDRIRPGTTLRLFDHNGAAL